MIHLYTGDGKGKTTAAIGLLIRYAGSGAYALFTQFMKYSPTQELKAFEKFTNITVVRNQTKHGFSINMTDEVKAAVRKEQTRHLADAAACAAGGTCKFIVLDEIVSAYALDLVDRDLFDRFLDDCPADVELVLTGRDPTPHMLEKADYVTEMKKIKHPYDKGVMARKGIEY